MSELTRRFPDRDEYEGSLADYRARLAAAHADREEYDPARQQYAFSLDANRRLLAKSPDDPARYASYAAAVRGGAGVLLHGGHDPEGYLRVAAEGLELCERVRRERTDWPRLVRPLAHLYVPTAAVLDRLGRREEARQRLDRGLSVWREMALRNPLDLDAHRQYGRLLYLDGHLRWPAEREAATARFTQAVGVLDHVLGEGGGRPVDAAALAEVLAGCPDPTVRHVPRALTLAREAAAGAGRAVLGACLFESGDYAGAVEVLDAVVTAGGGPLACRDWKARLYLAMARSRCGQGVAARDELDALSPQLAAEGTATWDVWALHDRAQEMVTGTRR
jgi:tetratricopeptide (TPR) repeat protein